MGTAASAVALHGSGSCKRSISSEALPCLAEARTSGPGCAGCEEGGAPQTHSAAEQSEHRLPHVAHVPHGSAGTAPAPLRPAGLLLPRPLRPCRVPPHQRPSPPRGREPRVERRHPALHSPPPGAQPSLSLCSPPTALLTQVSASAAVQKPECPALDLFFCNGSKCQR